MYISWNFLTLKKKMAYRSSKPSQNHLREGRYKLKGKKADSALGWSPHQGHLPLKVNHLQVSGIPGSKCLCIWLLYKFLSPRHWNPSNCCSVKTSSSLLIPSVCNYCPPQNKTHTLAHTPLNQRDDTLRSVISSNNSDQLLIYFWDSLPDLQERLSYREQIFLKYKSIKHINSSCSNLFFTAFLTLNKCPQVTIFSFTIQHHLHSFPSH